MRLTALLGLTGVCLLATPLHLTAEVLTGAERRAYEKTTSEGNLSTSCRPGSSNFVFWAGETPSTIDIEGTSQTIAFERHKVGDYINKPYRCQTSAGLLTITTKLTHSISNSECGAGNNFIAKLAVAKVGSFSDNFLVDGCGGTNGLLVRGDHVLLCRMPDGDTVGHCAEAADGPGPRRLR